MEEELDRPDIIDVCYQMNGFVQNEDQRNFETVIIPSIAFSRI